MKIRILFTAALMLFIFAGCENAAKDGEGTSKGDENTETSAPDLSGKYKVDPAKSSIKWTGTKTEAPDKHSGTLTVKDGSLEMDKEGYLTGGQFTIDMMSIVNTDGLPEKMKNDLENHLKSADFFDVENFTTATFTLTEVKRGASDGNYDVTGNLKVKDLSTDVAFPATVGKSGEEINASGNITMTQEDLGLAAFPATIDIAVMVVAKK